MRLLPPNTYGADPALRALLRAWLSPETMEWEPAGERRAALPDHFDLMVDGAA